jgi:glycosyltransferase involved in cell wall biosynthesis
MSKYTSKSVSVVLATHNGARYIEDQIRSIAAQTLLPLELIVSDDASTDNTLQIVHDLLPECRFRTKIHRNEKALGFRDNFLQACLITKGDFIAFCDQDDIWHPTKLERCSEFFDDKNISLIVHAAKLIDDRSRETGMFRQGIEITTVRPPLSYDPWDTFWGFSIVFRREIIELVDINYRFIDYIVPTERIAHDRWITLLGQLFGATAEIKDPLVSYRQHSHNLFGAGLKRSQSSASDLRNRSENYIEATSQMIEMLSNIPTNADQYFPLFDRQKCDDFLRSALKQLESRHRIYLSPTRLGALHSIWKCISGGYYRNVHDGTIRWGSLGRDVKHAALGT